MLVLKKQAQEVIQSEALRCNQPFINTRWLGGTLTNFTTILKSIRKLNESKQQEEEGLFNSLSKKKRLKKERS